MLLMTVCIGARADHWTAKTTYDYKNERALFIKVTVNGYTDTTDPLLEVAAFIDGECRAQATSTGIGGRYELMVVGDLATENNKVITFKAAYQGLEYDFTHTETFVENGALVNLTLNPIVGVTLQNPIEFSPAVMPAELNLMNYVTYKYADDTVSDNTTTLDVSQISFNWDTSNSEEYFSVDKATNILTTTTTETPTDGANLGLNVFGPVDPNPTALIQFSYSTFTMVKVTKAKVPVTGITLQPNNLAAQVGDDLSALLKKVEVIVTPETASDKSYQWTFEANEGEWVTATDNTISKPGVWHIVYSSTSNPEVTAILTVTVPTPVTFTVPAEVKLSKLRDVTIQFSDLAGDGFDKNLITFKLLGAVSNGDSPFTATPASDDGLKWTLRGKYVGDWNYEVCYDNRVMLTTIGGSSGVAHVEAEVVLPASGWGWISCTYTDAQGAPYSLVDGQGNYLEFLRADADHRVVEMRTQKQLLFNDPVEGFFGSITTLDPQAGMYKVRANYSTEGLNIINMGSTAQPFSKIKFSGDMHKGYNWITYPFEYDLTLEELTSIVGHEGDLIIGQTSQAAFDASSNTWTTGDGFKFEAGKGYIYYTEADEPVYPKFSFKGIPACYQQQPAGIKSHDTSFRFEEQRSGFAENMPIIAQIEGLANPEQFVLGAFVGDECRGQGRVGVRDILMLSASGKGGERVSFRLMNIQTGETYPVNEVIGYSQCAGSLKAPLQLTSEVTTGIVAPETGTKQRSAAIYDLSGRRLSAPRKGINIIDGKKVIY